MFTFLIFLGKKGLDELICPFCHPKRTLTADLPQGSTDPKNTRGYTIAYYIAVYSRRTVGLTDRQVYFGHFARQIMDTLPCQPMDIIE